MTPKYFTLKEVSLSNHCPECYSKEGLKLTFKQGFAEHFFYKSITDNISTDLYCNTCETPIFSGMWTREIEQVVAYHRRAISPKPTNTKLTSMAWLFIGIIIVVILAIVLFATGIVAI